jgi:hypothetical protein
MTKPIRIYMHINDLPGAWAVLEEQINRMAESGLIDAAEQITLCANGKSEHFDGAKQALAEFTNLRFVQVAGDAAGFEYPTLDFLQDECEAADQDFYICYLHLKGLKSGPNDVNVQDWRKFMEYWTIDQWEESVKQLDAGNDLVGTNIIEAPWLHSSGNFWWSRASYVKTLDRLQNPSKIKWGTASKYIGVQLDPGNFRYEHEAWIGSKNPKFAEVASTPGKQTPGWHFTNPWPETNYMTETQDA